MPPNTVPDQQAILESLKGHLEGLRKIINWALALAVVFWWSGIQCAPTINALGMSIRRPQAWIIASVIFVAGNAAAWDKLHGISDLIRMTDKQNIAAAISHISTHSWTANPFACLHSSRVKLWRSTKGLGTLISAWWVCNSSIYALLVYAPAQAPFYQFKSVPAAIFLVLGLSSMGTIITINKDIQRRARAIDSRLHAQLKRANTQRILLAFVGIAVGGAFSMGTQAIIASSVKRCGPASP